MRNYFLLIIAVICTFSDARAENLLVSSGSLDLRGVSSLNSDSVREDPTAIGRVKIDGNGLVWQFHSWLEGGWDGTVKRPSQDKDLFKNYSNVYQSNSPYIEIKELYAHYASNAIDLKAGIQRFAWGRLDEYPPNDLLNPWDYSQFLRKPLKDRKIGVPSLALSVDHGTLTYDTVWIPWFVPYRLPLPDERWSGVSIASALSQVPNAEITPAEPDLPPRTIENGTVGLRIRRAGEIEWAINLFHGFDPKPVFKTTSLKIDVQAGTTMIDPGYEPDLHRITSIGMDGAKVMGDWSIRAEAAYIANRYFNIRRELWGYPATAAPGVYPLNDIEHKSDSLDYGLNADYRLFEDGLLTMQAQQTMILNRPDTLYDKKVETILWANIKAGWMNQKVETNISIAYNPEHGAFMAKAKALYVFTDAWKAGITAIDLTGPLQSVFGRYAQNDQIEAELTYSW